VRADVLVAEIGSTVTKVHGFARIETPRPVWLGSGQAPTTVREGDVTAGLRRALSALEERLGGTIRWGRMMAASSAAGGLRMSVHGLVPDMTVRAAREAALGAGAILDLVTSGRMGDAEVAALRRTRPGLVLLAGGVEGGDRAVVVHNARSLVRSGVRAPVVYAGNSAAAEEVVGVLRAAGLEVRVVPNVYPRLDQLDVEPARQAIQSLFEEHIVRAPGMERVREMVQGAIRPTPGAVMEAARCLRAVLGDLVVFDVGGATTDVHSVTAGSPEIARLQLHPEPEAKRTVEGDLGVYVNAGNVVRLAGEEQVAEYMEEMEEVGAAPAADAPRAAPAADAPGAVEAAETARAPGGPGFARRAGRVAELLENLKPLPPGEMDRRTLCFVQALARIAAETALVRHAGRLRHLFGPTGRVTVAEGKDLTEVEWLVGTGGPLACFPNARETLSKLAALPSRVVDARSRPGERLGLGLLPGPPARPVLDRRYILAVLGVLHHDYPEAAETLLRESFQPQAAGDGSKEGGLR